MIEACRLGLGYPPIDGKFQTLFAQRFTNKMVASVLTRAKLAKLLSSAKLAELVD